MRMDGARARNRAGKTTTMPAVMGIVRPSGGEIRREGHPVRQADRVVSPWEVLAAALVMLAAIYGSSKLAARIYAAALVRGGARLSWGAALRLRENCQGVALRPG